MLNFTKAEIAGLILGGIVAVTGGTASASGLPLTCQVISGVVNCGSSGGTLTPFAGDVIIDTTGATSASAVASVAPACTLTATPATINAGNTSLLTASCTPAATSYVWTGGSCAGNTTASCSVSPSATAFYSVTGASNGVSSAPAPATVTVAAAAPPPPPPPPPVSVPVCSPAYGLMVGTSGVAANCSGATSFIWSSNPVDAVNGCTNSFCPITPAVTTTYHVTGSNSAGSGSGSVTVTVTPPTPVCTLAAVPAAIGTGESSTLTASCNPAATNGYAWGGGLTNMVATSGVSPTVTAIYSVQGINGNGTGTAASATVNVGTPVCTVTAGALSQPGGAGTNVTTTLTANCDRAVTGYTWTETTAPGVSFTPAVFPGNTAVAVFLPAVVTHTYTVKGTNPSGLGATGSVSVTPAVPVCTLTASPATVAPNGPSTLTASCTPAASSYTWTGGTCAGTNASATCAITPAATTSYTVAGINGIGAGAASSAATVTVSTAPPCPAGFACSTTVIDWPAGADTMIIPWQTMNAGQIRAFQFTQPATDMRILTLLANAPIFMTVTQYPYDFHPVDTNCQSGGQNDPTVLVTVTGFVGRCTVVAGQTYYINMRNSLTPDGPDTCSPGQTCRFQLGW